MRSRALARGARCSRHALCARERGPLPETEGLGARPRLDRCFGEHGLGTIAELCTQRAAQHLAPMTETGAHELEQTLARRHVDRRCLAPDELDERGVDFGCGNEHGSRDTTDDLRMREIR